MDTTKTQPTETQTKKTWPYAVRHRNGNVVQIVRGHHPKVRPSRYEEQSFIDQVKSADTRGELRSIEACGTGHMRMSAKTERRFREAVQKRAKELEVAT
jgi:hypothetical protein